MKMWGMGLIALIMAGGAQALQVVPAPPPPPPMLEWIAPDAENTLVIETEFGSVIIELRPEMAPKGVERVKTLARQGFYDGLLFHRVIEGFVAQTGNPDNKDGGKSKLPNLPLEAVFRVDTIDAQVAKRPGLTEGLIGATQVIVANPLPGQEGKPTRAWGTFCKGVVGMGHDDANDTANSELFIMLGDVPRLDKDYTVIGRVIYDGADLAKLLPKGEPPLQPASMRRVRVMADMPLDEQPKIEIANTKHARFKEWLNWERSYYRHGWLESYSICKTIVPTRTVP
ncbi:peptidylprolyl isomerase [Asticcacaulis sp. ZE23SCel15]|uniref:peptidylprolyl isomerase n=1 Tax=Asticcacaulis sp. ZE23SCel15 TaxID=3059027 RepID=UPI00266022E8|nr:peptidylprolyl isomerase [Asticcacaulis sp. ZE23SCel15]WKL57567.1 peptidylprolyl isomerase [Asticcacaulis sp. ZE23SCel15]